MSEIINLTELEKAAEEMKKSADRFLNLCLIARANPMADAGLPSARKGIKHELLKRKAQRVGRMNKTNRL